MFDKYVTSYRDARNLGGVDLRPAIIFTGTPFSPKIVSKYPDASRSPDNLGGGEPYLCQKLVKNGTWGCPPVSGKVTVFISGELIIRSTIVIVYDGLTIFFNMKTK